MKNIIYLFCLLLFTCDETVELPTEPVMGVAPIYASDPYASIASESTRSFENLGKIVYKNPYIYINERFQGLHVIDNIDPAQPKPIAFWNIPGLIDFTIKDNFLYAENGKDLISIDISNSEELKITSVLENINEIQNFSYPLDYTGWFECVDDSKGIVMRWEEKLLIEPQCWR